MSRARAASCPSRRGTVSARSVASSTRRGPTSASSSTADAVRTTVVPASGPRPPPFEHRGERGRGGSTCRTASSSTGRRRAIPSRPVRASARPDDRARPSTLAHATRAPRRRPRRERDARSVPLVPRPLGRLLLAASFRNVRPEHVGAREHSLWIEASTDDPCAARDAPLSRRDAPRRGARVVGARGGPARRLDPRVRERPPVGDRRRLRRPLRRGSTRE